MLEKSFCLWRLALEKDYFSTQLKLIVKTSHLYLLLLLSECRGYKHKLKSQNSREWFGIPNNIQPGGLWETPFVPLRLNLEN